MQKNTHSFILLAIFQLRASYSLEIRYNRVLCAQDHRWGWAASRILFGIVSSKNVHAADLSINFPRIILGEESTQYMIRRNHKIMKESLKAFSFNHVKITKTKRLNTSIKPGLHLFSLLMKQRNKSCINRSSANDMDL